MCPSVHVSFFRLGDPGRLAPLVLTLVAHLGATQRDPETSCDTRLRETEDYEWTLKTTGL